MDVQAYFFLCVVACAVFTSRSVPLPGDSKEDLDGAVFTPDMLHALEKLVAVLRQQMAETDNDSSLSSSSSSEENVSQDKDVVADVTVDDVDDDAFDRQRRVIGGMPYRKVHSNYRGPRPSIYRSSIRGNRRFRGRGRPRQDISNF